MKWPLRILGTIILLAVIAAAGAWFAFPWYAQDVVDRVAAGKGIRLVLHDFGRPGPGGVSFGRLDGVVTTPPDSCTGIAATFVVRVHNGRLTWRSAPSATGSAYRLTLEADSLDALMKPAGILFRDSRPLITGRVDLFRKRGLAVGFTADSVAYAVNGGKVETGKLKLEEVRYRALLTKSANWLQQPSRFQAASLFSDGKRTPLSGFAATFGLARNPEKPCTLIFSDCSVDLFGIRASTPTIEYSLRTKQSAFTLQLDSVPLERLPELAGIRNPNPSVSGVMSGSLPVEYLDTTVRIRNGEVEAGPGTLLVWKGSGGKPLFSFDAGGKSGGPKLLSGLNAEVTLNAKDEKLSGIRLGGLSTRLLGGSLTASPARYDAGSDKASCTVRLNRIPLFDRLRLHGEFSGKMKGQVSGTIPLSFSRDGIAVRQAKLVSPGGGTIRQKAARRTQGSEASPFSGGGAEVVWNFSEPSILLDREYSGKTKIGFTLKSLKRKSEGGELELTGLKGILDLPGERQHPSIVALSGFSAGFFDGSVSLHHVDYNLSTRQAATVVEVNGIPLQKLLDLQGAKKIFATGTVRGRLPIMLDGDSFSIPDGGIDAERSGQIIYSTTPEERALANAGMRMTYEALGNFLYSELISSITMTSDGKSHISLQLKGHNPEFQNGRPVNLNLTIEQNLLDLFRSLSISSGIEQEITEKVLRKNGKK